MTYINGKEYFQFILKKKLFIAEINSTVYLFEHSRLGCPVVAIKNDDHNKTFSAAFNTIPTDSTGVAHILEHSVLMGSEKYPVKDVFGEIHKGGLMTFLNAMTGSDITYYPFATRNIKEYFSIMDVYCDVVFKPLLDPATFEQEGWHYHQEAEDAPLEFQGVVYNEMKGAFSDPIRHIFHNIYGGLMPDSTYAHESGGDPRNIPDLSYQEFCDFHSQHYHASNGMYFFYGDAPLEEELQYLEKKFDAHFPEKGEKAVVIEGPGIKSPVSIHKTYAVDSTDTKEKTFIAVGTNIAKVTEREKNTAFQIIANILFNSDASPLKNRIVSSGLCKDFGGLYMASSSYQTFMLSYLVGSEAEHQEEFVRIYQEALQDMVENGLDHELVLSELNKFEFDYREDSSKAQRGLDLIGKVMPALKYGMDPFACLENESMLQDLRKKALEEGYFEQLIKEFLLDNPATVTLSLSPDPQKQLSTKAEEEARLQSYDQQLSETEKVQRIARTQELMQEQQEANSVENLALLPSLTLKDLSTSFDFHQASTVKVADKDVLISDLDTNHIAYIDLGFDFSAIPAHLLPWFDIFGTIITEIGTEQLNYMSFAKEVATSTGGFSFSASVYGNIDREKTPRPIAWFHLKCLPDYLERAVSLISSLLSKPSFADRARIQEIVGREFAWTDHSAQSEGYGLAAGRAEAQLSIGGAYREMYGGITAYRALKDLALNYEQREETFLAGLEEIAHLLLNQQNLQIGITANRPQIEHFLKLCPALIKSLPTHRVSRQKPPVMNLAKHEAFITSAEVVFAIQGANLFPQGSGYNGHFEVLKTYFSRDYLWNTVRQMGGAYGCFIQFSQLNGNMLFVSYRDPQVAKTYDAYNRVAEVTKNLSLPREVMDQLIIGTYGGFTPHQSQASRGAVARNEFISGITPQYKEARIEEIISTEVGDLRKFAPLLEEMLTKSHRTAIGNRAKLEQDASLFDRVEEL
ncbi:insulinase family protein [Desulfotalea psychrophila]|uniref:Related to zinc metalloprotease n=1 Tax=Desulfotalea psychrophila (strain LSv54 / DSM 12343) TaxID=177439 RepID=Q6AS25_DESPS|nr:insulinase family protein [Desulfotalea psychrophila]CAG34850.1 related to zinc metalloprotease [Desulfotalea psychrophila LSv54]